MSLQTPPPVKRKDRRGVVLQFIFANFLCRVEKELEYGVSLWRVSVRVRGVVGFVGAVVVLYLFEALVGGRMWLKW